MRNSALRSALIVAMLGCGSRQPTSQPAASTAPPPPPTTAPASAQQCPMMKDMAAASIVASDTEDGVAITFTTTGDVDALRRHVHQMAEMHGTMAPHDGSGEHAGAQGRMMHKPAVPSRATVEDIPGGARVVLVPNDPSQLAALREHVREHVAMMQRGECPMMAQPADEHAHPGG